MYSQGVTLATKGILNNNGITLATAGFLVLAIEQGVVNDQVNFAVGYSPHTIRFEPLKKDRIDKREPEKKYYVKVTFQHENEIYTQVKYSSKNVHITLDDIELEIVDNKPVVKINIIE